MRLARAERSRPGEPLVVYSAMGLAVLLVARFYPFDRFPFVACPMRTYLHIPCLTCGMTRAFVRVVHGQLGGAFTVSPLGAVLALATAGAVGYAALRLTVLGRGFTVEFSLRESRAVRLAAVLAVLGNWTYLLVSGAAS